MEVLLLSVQYRYFDLRQTEMAVVRSEAEAGLEHTLQVPGMPEETPACQPRQ